MQRLTRGDQFDAVKRLLGERLTLNPDGLGFTDYADTEAHVTAILHIDAPEPT